MATPEKLYFSTALEIGAGGLLCTAALLQNVTESLTGEPHNGISYYPKTLLFKTSNLKIHNQKVWLRSLEAN